MSNDPTQQRSGTTTIISTSRLNAVSDAETRAARALDQAAAFKWFAVFGALVAAIAPAVMATSDGPTLRGSVSAYWDVEPSALFTAPFTIAAGLLLLDGAVSYVAKNRRIYGGRWYNLVLGVSLAVLTWFDKDNDPLLHYPAAVCFFFLFMLVIVYKSLLQRFGRHRVGDPPHDRDIERAGAEVSLVFVLLLVVTLAAWIAGFVNFFFFEIFALVNFAQFHVQASLRAFPNAHYEFRNARLNAVLRAILLMPQPRR